MTDPKTTQGLAWIFRTTACSLGVLVAALTAHADTITIKIFAANRSPTETQDVTVKAFLPRPATKDDVISAGDLDISYDVATQSYYVHKKLAMEPGTRVFEVVLKDIWVVPAATRKDLADHAKALVDMLKGTDKEDTASNLAALIDENLKLIASRQEANAVGLVRPADHIRAYEANVEVLGRVQRDTGLLENLAVAAGRDPQRLMGTPRSTLPADIDAPHLTGDVVTIVVTTWNPSLTTQQTNELFRSDLPAEVQSTDVLDAGGLQVGFDTAHNVSYVYKTNVVLAPQETNTFALKIRNPWSDALLRIPALVVRLGELKKLVKNDPQYKSVMAQSDEILKEIDAIKSQGEPEQIDEQYVAFARNRHAALRGLESRVMRLEELFQPGERPMKWGVPVMDIPRPDRRTTWVIIYAILAFLALFSVFFFFRWYGRTKDEELRRKAGRTTSAGETSASGGESTEAKP